MLVADLSKLELALHLEVMRYAPATLSVDLLLLLSTGTWYSGLGIVCIEKSRLAPYPIEADPCGL